MLPAITTTLLIVLSLAVALRPPKDDQLIGRRPYNNRSSDATAARQDWLG